MARKRSEGGRVAPGRMVRRKRERSPDVASGRPEPGPNLGVMYMVERRHRDALADAALRLRDEKGGTGRADASRVLRGILDQWIEGGARLPASALEGE